jgi:hypothetical protein
MGRSSVERRGGGRGEGCRIRAARVWRAERPPDFGQQGTTPGVGGGATRGNRSDGGGGAQAVEEELVRWQCSARRQREWEEELSHESMERSGAMAGGGGGK